MTLHITNGDTTVTVMESAGIGGEFLPWCDVLHEGPVPAGLTLEEMSESRARFIADSGWQTDDKARDDFRARDAKLACFREHEEVILWFEHDLYDQLQLLQILDWLSGQDFGATSFTMIYPSDLSWHYAAPIARRAVSETSSSDAGASGVWPKAWSAFCSPDPRSWESLMP